MKAVKGNKEYTIDEAQQKGYQASGFDILDDDGRTIAYGRGKTVPYDEYVRAVNEIERLQKLVIDQNAEIEVMGAGLNKVQESTGGSDIPEEQVEKKQKTNSKKASE